MCLIVYVSIIYAKYHAFIDEKLRKVSLLQELSNTALSVTKDIILIILPNRKTNPDHA